MKAYGKGRLPPRNTTISDRAPGDGSGRSAVKAVRLPESNWKYLLVLTGFVFVNLVWVTQFVELDSNHAAMNGAVNMAMNLYHTGGTGSGKTNGPTDEGSDSNYGKDNNNNNRRDTEASSNLPKTTVTKTESTNAKEEVTTTVDDKKDKENKDKKENNIADAPEIRYIARAGRRRRRRNHQKKKEDSNRTLTPEEKLKYTYVETAIAPNVSNAVYYRDIPPEFLVRDPDRFLWDRTYTTAGTNGSNGTVVEVPEWMKDYFRWHRYKRSTWNLTDWQSERWLISQCLKDQDPKKCGGTADRLKPLPTLLRRAWETKRIYLIRWTRPAMLEEFLVPPEGGFDWRVPGELTAVLGEGKRLSTRQMIEKYTSGGMSLVRARYQTDEPHRIYDRYVFGPNRTGDGDDDGDVRGQDQPGFERIFAVAWKIAFTPSLPVQDLLRAKLAELGLVPNQYAASHLRALYGETSRPSPIIQKFTQNALACATELTAANLGGVDASRTMPIFFASDSKIAIRHALSLSSGGEDPLEGLPRVVASSNPSAVHGESDGSTGTGDSLVHLDSLVAPVEAFYDTFVDLYLMAMARCVTYGRGGYGHWALLIGGHLDCAKRQHIIGRRIKNEATDLCHVPEGAAASGGLPPLPAGGEAPREGRAMPVGFGNDGTDGPLFLPPAP
ncbi:unnamed protein product [Pseudo-nitzschia multistriata]|uniref:Transmembrane protein n=1 Tax=Pseudo-nitzschia multistriata TaxID=183589 RepID=A0A448ZT55_9STRA|nr:unnamed protein product [Pseudo-nitzschia multistriata]